ncbi:uncharacterized protein AB675_5521 [Cyphellophora attinorum]|uniref:Uncharacterized protein n=1 Tax=Cyphellophora attinorum TaxID=1664694 RepID=A0A0N1HC47_9EURO|nr:uncharacterized protein AB675_5521 [Phialophora attinorum]KPI42163.1 hypothetical protein AB675_5521 [Phialophora attinorum]
MDTPTIYTLASTAWLSLQALPLLFTPKLIITLLAETDAHVATITEIYFARLLAIAQLSIIVFSLLPPAASSGTSPQQQQQPPYALTFTHVASFVYIYAHYTTLTSALGSSTPNTTGLLLGLLGNGILSSMGIFMTVFSGTAAHVSKRTGADKRTSGWPFGNVNAYNPKKDRATVASRAEPKFRSSNALM